MITGSTPWNIALADPGWKWPLYTFEIPEFNVVATSFDSRTVSPAVTNLPPYQLRSLYAGTGPSQAIEEINGTSSISGMEVQCSDPSNVLKPLIGTQNLIGLTVYFKLGFPGLDYSQFVILHTMQILSRPQWNSDGRIKFELTDSIRNQVYKVFNYGGPAFWAPGDPTPPAPVGATLAQNGQPISSQNPLWLQGNPIDILLGFFQNYLGLGQNPAALQTQWRLFIPGNDSTLINPNPLVDVPGALALRNAQFSGDFMSFNITSPQVGKNWAETQILKPLGLYTIVRASGQMSFKSTKSPASITPTAIGQNQIYGIPNTVPWDIVNVLQARTDFKADSVQSNSSSQKYNQQWTYWDANSINQNKQQLVAQVESQGLLMYRGAFYRMGLNAQRTFARHAFSTPIYDVATVFSFIGLELGDYVSITHPVMLDFKTGNLGVTDVVCEVIDRQPDYANGRMKLKVADTRFISLTTPFTVAPNNGTTPAGVAVIGTSTIF